MTLYMVTPTGAGPIEVYDGSAACDAYLATAIGDGADAYAAADPNTRLRLLVAATRFIDRQAWRGTANAAGGTTLQWPRSGIDGIDPATVPAVIVQAVFELVAILADDPDVQSAPDAGSNVESLGAGSARLSFFRPSSVGDGNATVLPPVINQLIGWLLATADPSLMSVAGIATGTSACSDFGYCYACSGDPCFCRGPVGRSGPL